MLPRLRPGDRLLVDYRRAPRPGVVVVARFVDGTIVVKRAAERRGTGWWLLSDNAGAGTDSRHRGPVPEPDVWGTVLARVWPSPRWVRDI
ncbi:MAG: peptidase S24 [Sandaracinus sp.]|nr:peptidase S24 [Sandaracinus sp.]